MDYPPSLVKGTERQEREKVVGFPLSVDVVEKNEKESETAPQIKASTCIEEEANTG